VRRFGRGRDGELVLAFVLVLVGSLVLRHGRVDGRVGVGLVHIFDDERLVI
jgi:hypothetical protein